MSRSQFNRALTLYLCGVVLSLAANVYFVGGSRSPLSKAFFIIVLIAGLLGKRKIAVWLFAASIVVILFLFAVSMLGLVPQPDMNPRTLVILDNLVLVIVLIVTLTLTTQVVQNRDLMQLALKQREIDIVEAIKTAESAHQMENQVRHREQLLIEQMQTLVQTYVSYLENVGKGDYSAQLATPDYEFSNVPELVLLSRSLRETIDQLVTKIKDAEIAQTMYIQRAWQSFISQGKTEIGYLFNDEEPHVKAITDVWLPAMNKAIDTENLVAENDEMGLTLKIRGAVIGALGLKRKDQSNWSDDEVIMVRDIVDQLTQTLERLRLVDDISQRASLEATASRITANIRSEVDIEGILERAISELGTALQAEKGHAQLSFTEMREDTA
jgi:hypothetical protein